MILHPIIDRLKIITELLPTAIGGEFVPTGTKQISITENGTTTENVTSYANAEITVNVPPSGIIPTGTKQISITENGTTTEDVTQYANAEITVNVANGKTLLASGTFTQASQTSFMSIPISFSGTATEGAIVGEPTQDTACTYATYVLNDLQPITDSPFDGSISMNVAQTSNNIVVRGYSNTSLESNRIYMYNNSSSYPIKPGDYKWYIWGYAE